MNRWVGIVLSVVVLAVLFFGIGSPVGMDGIQRLAATTGLWAIVAAVVLFWVNFAVSTERYRLILSGMPVPSTGFMPLYRLTFLSLFLAHFVAVGPAADVVRVGYARLRMGLPMAEVLESVVYDRVLALAGLAFLGLLLLPLQLARGVPDSLLLLQLAVWVASLAAVALMIRGARIGVLGKFRHFARLIRSVQGFLPVVWARGRRWPQAALALGYASSYALVIWVLARGMGLGLDALDVLQFGPFILLAQSLPVFYMGWGARETVVAGVLGTHGLLSVEQALAVSVATGITFFIAALPGALLRPRRSVGDGQ